MKSVANRKFGGMEWKTDSMKVLRTRDNNCSKSSETLQSTTLLAEHRKLHPNQRYYPCKFCPRILKSRDTLIGHLKTHSDEHKIHHCNLCDKKFRRSDGWANHMKKTHGVLDLTKCPLCKGQKFKTCSELVFHLRLVHVNADNSFACDICGLEFTCSIKNGYLLLNHRLTHTENSHRSSGEKENEGDYQVNSTTNYSESKPMTFGFPDQMVVHSKTHGSSKMLHQCHLCFKNFSLPQRLSAHYVTHKEKTFKCPHCSRAFASLYYLSRHIVVHSRPRSLRIREKKQLLRCTFRIGSDGSLLSSSRVSRSINFQPQVLVCSRLKHTINLLIQS